MQVKCRFSGDKIILKFKAKLFHLITNINIDNDGIYRKHLIF